MDDGEVMRRGEVGGVSSSSEREREIDQSTHTYTVSNKARRVTKNMSNWHIQQL